TGRRNRTSPARARQRPAGAAVSARLHRARQRQRRALARPAHADRAGLADRARRTWWRCRCAARSRRRHARRAAVKQWGIRARVFFLALAPSVMLLLALVSYFTYERIAEVELSLGERGKLVARRLAAPAEFHIF